MMQVSTEAYMWDVFFHLYWQEGSSWWIHHTQWVQRLNSYFPDVISASLMKNIFWTNCHACSWPSLPHKVSRAWVFTALEDLTNTGKMYLACTVQPLSASSSDADLKEEGARLVIGFKSVNPAIVCAMVEQVFSNFFRLHNSLGTLLKCRFWLSSLSGSFGFCIHNRLPSDANAGHKQGHKVCLWGQSINTSWSRLMAFISMYTWRAF